MLTLMSVILFSALMLFLFFLAKRYLAEKQHLEKTHIDNVDLIKVLRNLIEKIEKDLPVAEKRLEILKEKIPEKQFLSLKELLEVAKKNLPSQKKELAKITVDHIQYHMHWGWKKDDIVSAEIENLLDQLGVENKFSEAVNKKAVELKEAETKSQKLLAELPGLIESANKELRHLDVSSKAKEDFEKARADFEKAKILVRDVRSSWLTIFARLSAIMILVLDAKEKGKEHR